jgi:hypothetical protein
MSYMATNRRIVLLSPSTTSGRWNQVTAQSVCENDSVAMDLSESEAYLEDDQAWCWRLKDVQGCGIERID